MTPLRRNRQFTALWIGQTVSALGISISAFAYPLVVLEATGSAVKAGLVGSVLTATTFVLRLPAGALVDRWNRRTILVCCDLGRALVCASFALALALGHFVLAHVLLVAFVEASLGVLFGPAEAAAVRRVVPPEQVREAVARNQSRSQIAGVLGPPLGGGLLGVSRALPFLADALSYLVSLACVLLVRRSLQDPPRDRSEEHPLREMFEGVRWIWQRPFVRALLLWLAAGGAAFSSLGLVILVLARDRGASPGELGAMFALTSAGGVLGAFAAPRLLRAASPRALVLGFAWTLAATVLLLLPAHSPYLIGLLGAAAFFLSPAVTSLVFATIAADAPDELQGRATAAAIQVASVGAPIGPLLAGVLLGHFGPTRTLLSYGVFLVALAVVASTARALRVVR